MELEPCWLLKPQEIAMAAHFYLLKLSVFKKLRLGGLRARFWSLRASILEAPGLDFGRFWDRFFEIFERFWLHVFEMAASQPQCQESQRLGKL